MEIKVVFEQCKIIHTRTKFVYDYKLQRSGSRINFNYVTSFIKSCHDWFAINVIICHDKFHKMLMNFYNVIFVFLLAIVLAPSCNKVMEVDAPINSLTSDNVFNND